MEGLSHMVHVRTLQVKHKYTNQVMVMKEMRRATKEAKFTFLQEVQMAAGVCLWEE